MAMLLGSLLVACQVGGATGPLDPGVQQKERATEAAGQALAEPVPSAEPAPSEPAGGGGACCGSSACLAAKAAGGGCPCGKGGGGAMPPSCGK